MNQYASEMQQRFIQVITNEELMCAEIIINIYKKNTEIRVQI
jgi:hypothetical protein